MHFRLLRRVYTVLEIGSEMARVWENEDSADILGYGEFCGIQKLESSR